MMYWYLDFCQLEVPRPYDLWIRRLELHTHPCRVENVPRRSSPTTCQESEFWVKPFIIHATSGNHFWTPPRGVVPFVYKTPPRGLMRAAQYLMPGCSSASGAN